VTSEIPSLELMLHVITARGMLGWRTWREAYEAVAENADGVDAISPSQGSRILDNLAHVEVAIVSGDLKLAAAPAVMARLPRAGLPTAVLCGGRSPQTERKLREATIAHSTRLLTIPSAPERRRPPRSFFVEAEDVAHLARTAQAAGIQFAEVPPAWALANSIGSVESYLSSIIWRHEPTPNLPASEVDPVTLLLSCNRVESGGWRLTKYFPRRLPPYFELRDAGRASRVDRDWGMYALMWAHGRNCLIHDARYKIVAVPSGAPLPRLFGRVLSLCSGLAPAWLPKNSAGWKLPEPNGYHIYTNVPDTIGEIVFSKLGQSPLPLHVPTEFLRLLHSHRPI